MSGPAWVAVLALLAVLAVLALVVADLAAAEPVEAVEVAEPVVIDQSGRIVATQELPVFRHGRHRAQGRWSR